MPYALPNLRHDPSQLISLHDGFYRTGRFMFPDDWIGTEACAWPTTDTPDGLTAQRAQLEAKAKRASDREFAFRIADTFNLSSKQYEQHLAAHERAKSDHDLAKIQLHDFKNRFTSRFEDAAAYDRRCMVERTLCAAIRAGEIALRIGFGTGVQIGNWMDDPRSQISFVLSQVISPMPYTNGRRHPGYFCRASFDAWAAPKERSLAAHRSDSIEEQMIEWFLIYRADCLAKGVKTNKEDSLEICQTHFARQDLGRNFDAVWKLLSTDAMRRIGRPKQV